MSTICHAGRSSGTRQAKRRPDLKIIDGDEVRRREPTISKEVKGGSTRRPAGEVCPWTLAIAMCEIAGEK
jgi:L-2-hydroxyglutarate oxidase LhgO